MSALSAHRSVRPMLAGKPAFTGAHVVAKRLSKSVVYNDSKVERIVAPQSSSSGAVAGTPEPEGFQWGANMKNLSIAVALGTAVWFAPNPAGVSAQAWHLLAIFVATIVGIITQPLPLGAVAMIGLGVSMVTKTLTFAQAFSAFSSEIPYAFHLVHALA